MGKKIIISRSHNIAAVIHQDQVEELIIVHKNYQVNNIYLGIINKIFKSINAAFVKLDLGGKSGFLHASDSVPLKRKHCMNNISEILTTNQKVLVQVIREPTVQKGPRLTANITLLGKYIILMPFSKTICISRKISNKEERFYLKALAILVKPCNMGILFRQYASGVDEEIILQEINALKKQWYFIEKSAISSIYPSILYKDHDVTKRVLRDFCNVSITNIFVDSARTLLQLQKYFHSNTSLIKSEDVNLKLSVRENYLLGTSYIMPAILNALKTKIRLPLGGYIYIETSEALTMIDVNSGSFNDSPGSKETVLRTNCSAATEIAYQLRIRNITGVILIDFINMHKQQDQIRLLKHFCQILELDNAKPQIIQLSELGLIELTRKRKGKNLAESFKLSFNTHQYRDGMNKYLNRYSSVSSNGYGSFNTNSIFFKKIFSLICLSIPIHKSTRYLTANFNSGFKNKQLMYNTNLLINQYTIRIIPLYLYQTIVCNLI